MHIEKDTANFYTYSKEYNNGAFPVVDEVKNIMIEKLAQEARWKTKNGLDILNKRENWNEHPKKPP